MVKPEPDPPTGAPIAFRLRGIRPDTHIEANFFWQEKGVPPPWGDHYDPVPLRMALYQAQVALITSPVIPLSWATIPDQNWTDEAGIRTLDIRSYLSGDEATTAVITPYGDPLPPDITFDGTTLTYDGTGSIGSYSIFFLAVPDLGYEEYSDPFTININSAIRVVSITCDWETGAVQGSDGTVDEAYMTTGYDDDPFDAHHSMIDTGGVGLWPVGSYSNGLYNTWSLAVPRTYPGFGPTANAMSRVAQREMMPCPGYQRGTWDYNVSDLDQTDPQQAWNLQVTPRAGNYMMSTVTYREKRFMYRSSNLDYNGDYLPVVRSQWGPNAINYPPRTLDWDVEFYFGFSVFLPETWERDWAFSNNLSSESVMWINAETTSTHMSVGIWPNWPEYPSKPLDNESYWHLNYAVDATRITEGSINNNEHVHLGPITPDLGLWTDFVFRVRFNPFTSTTNPALAGISGGKNQYYDGYRGICEIWKSTGLPLDGLNNRAMTKVFSLVNQPFGLVPKADGGLGYFFDLYKSQWEIFREENRRWDVDPRIPDTVEPYVVDATYKGNKRQAWYENADQSKIPVGPIWTAVDEFRSGAVADGTGYSDVLPFNDGQRQHTGTNHYIPLATETIDGNVLGIQPGDTITLQGGVRRDLNILNLTGTATQPITVRNDPNSSQRVVIRAAVGYSGGFQFLIRNCEHFIIDGTFKWQGAPSTKTYGIAVLPAETGFEDSSAMLPIADKGRNFIIRGVEIDGGWDGVSGSGGEATANASTLGLHFPVTFYTRTNGIFDNMPDSVAYDMMWRENILVEHCYFHHLWGEGWYAGPNPGDYRKVFSSGPYAGQTLDLLQVRNVEARFNRIEYTGRNAINWKSWNGGYNSIHDNYCRYNGHRPWENPASSGQRSAIAGSNLGGITRIYNNTVMDSGACSIFCYNFSSSGHNPLWVPGTMEAFNNLCVRSHTNTLNISDDTAGAINYANAATSTGLGTCKIYHNTIVDTNPNNVSSSPKAIYMSGMETTNSFIRDNFCVYKNYNFTSIYNPNGVPTSGNIQNVQVNSAGFANPTLDDYRIALGSPAYNAGAVRLGFIDHDRNPRARTGAQDVGAYEYQE